jgi:hypothetical protein
MRNTMAQGLALSAVLLGSLVGAPAVYSSTITNHSGAICKNVWAGDATKIENLSAGIQSTLPYPTKVICPLTRATTRNQGAIIYVNVNHKGNQTTRCTGYSHDEHGPLLKSNSAHYSGPGSSYMTIDLRGSGESNFWSDYSVICTIPGSKAGLLLGADLVEQ